ncbi:MAG: hypothetical protein LBB45_03370 [Methanobrevibacter sp.]|nr:hypothetical protein [Candidatus Methanovirga basalitermitum]
MNEIITQTENNTITTTNEENTIDKGRVDVEYAIQQWKAYQTLTQRLLDESDYQDIKGKRFKKKSAWRKLCKAFNLSTTIIDREIMKDDKGRVNEATFIVRATEPSGRYVEAYGSCSRREHQWGRPNHDVPSTAQTRATNRAISDLIGAGEVTAEEMKSNNDSSSSSSSYTTYTTKSKNPKPVENTENDIPSSRANDDEKKDDTNTTKADQGNMKHVDTDPDPIGFDENSMKLILQDKVLTEALNRLESRSDTVDKRNMVEEIVALLGEEAVTPEECAESKKIILGLNYE